MQFSYRVSESDYLRSRKLIAKQFRRGVPGRQVLFWLFILICLVLLWTIVEKDSKQASSNAPSSGASVTMNQGSNDSQPVKNTGNSTSLLVNVGPFIVLAGVWTFMMVRFRSFPRRQYNRDPTMHGTFTVDVTADYLCVENSVGSSSKSNWKIYEYWSEAKDIVLLKNFSGSYFLLSTSGLDEGQKTELKGILSSVLTRK